MLSWLASSLLVSSIKGLTFSGLLGTLAADLKAFWQWLCKDGWRLVSLGLAIFAAVQHFQLLDARHDRDAYAKQRDELKRQLDAISTKRNEQKVITRDNIVTVTKTIHDADGRAKVIEQAPLLGDCRTPAPILGADL